MIKQTHLVVDVSIWFPINDRYDDDSWPDYWYKYDTDKSLEERFSTVADWLTDEDIDLAVMYFHEPDQAGHNHGAFSEQVKDRVLLIDEHLSDFIDRLNASNLLSTTNIMITADHGMANKLPEPFIYLEDYLDLGTEVKMVPQQGTLAGIIPRLGYRDQIYEKLLDAHPNMTVYLKEDIPERYHYKNNPRVPPIVAIADEGYLILRVRLCFTTSIHRF